MCSTASAADDWLSCLGASSETRQICMGNLGVLHFPWTTQGLAATFLRRQGGYLSRENLVCLFAQVGWHLQIDPFRSIDRSKGQYMLLLNRRPLLFPNRYGSGGASPSCGNQPAAAKGPCRAIRPKLRPQCQGGSTARAGSSPTPWLGPRQPATSGVAPTRTSAGLCSARQGVCPRDQEAKGASPLSPWRRA
jgi:hypothetical protein